MALRHRDRKGEDTMADEIGNMKAMREALEWLHHDIERQAALDREMSTDNAVRIGAIREALAAPARNCDMPLVVDGPADNNADKAWLVFKYHNPDAYFDVSGLLRCIDWLLAPATEQNGENNGSK